MRRVYRQKGITFIACLIFLVVFLAFGVSMAALSGANVQLSANQRHAVRALAGAESGLEVMRYWLSHVMMDASTPTSDYLTTIINQVKFDLQTKNATNMKLSESGTLQPVPIDAAQDQTFSANLAMNATNPYVLDVTITGRCEQIARSIRVGFRIAPYEHPIFKYGLATKGPIQFPRTSFKTVLA